MENIFTKINYYMKKRLFLMIVLSLSLNTFSQSAEDYYDSANKKHYQGNYLGALSDFNKSIQLDPKQKRIYCDRGYTNEKLGNLREAIYDFNKCVQIMRQYYPGFVTQVTVTTSLAKAHIKFELEDYSGAIADFTTYLNLMKEWHPNDIYEYELFYRGLAKLNLGDKNGACLDFSKAGEGGYSRAYNLIQVYCN